FDRVYFLRFGSRGNLMNDFSDEAEDSEDQFLKIAGDSRAKYDVAYDDLPDDGSVFPLLHRYMSTVLPAAHFFKIEALAEWERPDSKVSNLRDYYDRFMHDVDYCVAELKLRQAARSKRFTVALSLAAKKQISVWLQEGREFIEREDLAPEKKDRLLRLIDQLQREVDRDRTPVHAAGQLMNTIFAYARENYFTNVEPILRSIGLVGGEIGAADEAQHGHKPLPDYPKPKRLEPPIQKSKPKSGGFGKMVDDEIPF
ncbi:MAG: hypothetical protein J0I81_15895, partial [Hyphomicrobium sp.]|nr:hypothetical protein [Hyphomicrobium sp.]